MTEEEAHELLQRAIGETRDRGGRPYAAGLKPRMQSIARAEGSGTFSEADLGFPTFRAFLESASSAGIIELIPTPIGNDLEVILAGGTATAPFVAGRSARIRADLWQAFVRWGDGTGRLFDLRNGRALVVEGTEVERLRSEEPDRFLDIEPLDREATRAMMAAFLTRLPDSEQDALRLVLDNKSPEAERDFVAALQASPARLHQWRSFQIQEIARRIHEWAAANNQTLSIYSGRRPVERQTSSRHQPRDAKTEQDHIRKHILEMLDKLPLAELLRLRIPVEYMLPGGDRTTH